MKRNRKLATFDALEPRMVPALFGVPWANPAQLTLSFAPDGTAIAGHTSQLNNALDETYQNLSWQDVVARAFQTWAAQTNLNIRIVPDSGDPFAQPGLTQSDPRFGDIRLGAHAMGPEVLAVTVPYGSAVTGTLAGDIFLNTQYTFDGAPYDLFSVMLHEAGHALGLAHSTNTASPMFDRFNNTKTTLTSGDVTAIRALYGSRAADSYEGSTGNATLATASAFRQPAGYNGQTPLVAFGDLRNASDVDTYTFTLPDPANDDDEQVSIRLVTAGVSLLKPRLSVYDGRGQLVTTTASESHLGDILQFQIDADDVGENPEGRYYIRVEAAEPGVFGAGGYALAVRYDERSAVNDEALDRVLQGPHARLSAADVDALFRDPEGVFFNRDNLSNDTPARARTLSSTPGYASRANYQAVGSIHTAADRDVYRIRTPSTTPVVLTASVWSTDPRGLRPVVTVVDAAARAVPFEVIASGNGIHTIQLRDALPGADYFVTVQQGRSATPGLGNYFLNVETSRVVTPLESLATADLAPSAPTRDYTLYVATSQQMHLLLGATATSTPNPSAQVELEIRDQADVVLHRLRTYQTDTASLGLFLTPGAYSLRVRALPLATGAVVPSRFGLRAAVLSDPIGPVVEDPILQPIYTSPNEPGTYVYPDGVRSKLRYRLIARTM